MFYVSYYKSYDFYYEYWELQEYVKFMTYYKHINRLQLILFSAIVN